MLYQMENTARVWFGNMDLPIKLILLFISKGFTRFITDNYYVSDLQILILYKLIKAK